MNRFSMALLLLLPLSAFAQAQDAAEPSPIVFIYDSSGSMWGQIDGKAKVEIAREVMANTLGNLADGQRVGLVAYGHRSEGDCQDVETLLSDAEPSAIPPALNAIRPLGKTPLAWSATQVIERLKQDRKKATVILLTDGIESCGGNLCEVVGEARANGIEFILHIVGFGLQADETDALRCAAQAGGGRYFDADNAEQLSAGLDQATAQTVDLVANVSVKVSKNGQPLDAAIKAFLHGESKPVEHARSYHDGAAFFLPAGTYDLEIIALENTDLRPIWLRGIEISEDEVSEYEVRFDAGTVRVNVLNNDQGWDSLVKLLDGDEVVAQTRTYGRPSDMQVPPGRYAMHIKALAVEGTTTTFDRTDIEVRAAEISEVIHPFASGIAMIGVSMGDELVDAVVTIRDQDSGQRVAGSRTYTSAGSNPRQFVLTPGTYTVEYSTLGKHKGHGDSFEISVLPNETSEHLIELQ